MKVNLRITQTSLTSNSPRDMAGLKCRGVTIQENRIAIYCDIFSLYCDILRYIPFLIFSVKLN